MTTKKIMSYVSCKPTSAKCDIIILLKQLVTLELFEMVTTRDRKDSITFLSSMQ